VELAGLVPVIRPVVVSQGECPGRHPGRVAHALGHHLRRAVPEQRKVVELLLKILIVFHLCHSGGAGMESYGGAVLWRSGSVPPAGLISSREQ
jgi:hypothetical protein